MPPPRSSSVGVVRCTACGATSGRFGVRGSVLVIVLVTILFAVAALVAFVDKAGDDLIVEAREAAARRLRQEAYSALEVTLAVLQDFRLVNGGLRSPAEGWNDPLGFAGWQPRDGCVAEVAFEDESGKLSLPNADAATLVNLFESWEMSQVDAERLADALLSWMRKDHVPATSRFTDYEQGATPYGPPLRSLRSYSELAAIDFAREVFYEDDGTPAPLWHRFVDAVSLLDFKQTNINAGRADVSAALGVQDRSQQQLLREYLGGLGDRSRQGPGFFQTPAEAAALIGSGALSSSYGTEISALRVTITVREGRTAFRVSAVVAPEGGAKLVEAVAAGSEANPSTDAPAAAAPAAASAETAAGGAGKKLNYPFTLLEIRENGAIPTAPAAETEA